jgi:hypothetical protein
MAKLQQRCLLTGDIMIRPTRHQPTKPALSTFAFRSPAESPKTEPSLRTPRPSDDSNDGVQESKAASVV